MGFERGGEGWEAEEKCNGQVYTDGDMQQTNIHQQ